MASSTDLRVKISADLADIKQGLGLLRGELAKVKRASESSAPNAGKWRTALGSVRAQLAGLVSIYAALGAVRWYANQADQAANLAGRLRLATKSQKEFEAAQRGTFQIAQQSSAEWEAVVGLYASLAQTTGMSQKGVLSLTKVISQSFQVSGASAQEASNGLRQIQQALAGGTLRAEEFNTIIDTSPRIVQALADHFGISFGQVRKYVNDGKISSREFAEAMLKASGDIQEDFDKLPTTVSRATQQVRNALLAMVGETDKATGASNDLAEGILDLARTLESPDVMNGFRAFVGGIATSIGMLVKFMSTTASVAKFLGEEIAARVSGPAIGDTVRIEQEIVRQQGRIAAARAAAWKSGLKDPENSAGVKGAKSRLAELQAMLKASQDMAVEAAAQQQAAGDTKKAADEATASIDQLLEGMPEGGGSGKGKGKAQAAKKIEQLAESTVLARDEIARSMEDIASEFEDGKLSVAAYYTRRTQLQQQVIDLQLQELRSELALADTKGRRRDIEERIAILERDRTQAAVTGMREQINAQDELSRKKLEGYGGQLSSITGGLSAQEQSISAQLDAGTLGRVEAERRLQEVRKTSIGQLVLLREKLDEYLKGLQPGDPNITEAVQGLQGIDLALANIAASMDTFGRDVESGAFNSLGSLFRSIREEGTLTVNALRGAVADFAASIYDSITGNWAKNIASTVRGWFGGLMGNGAEAAAETTAATAAATIQTTAAATASATVTAGATAASTALTTGAVTGASALTTAGAAVATSIVTAAIQAAAILQAQASASAATSALSLASAKGNVFDGSGLRAFARGAAFPAIAAFAAGGAFTNQVVASPTLFAFGKGGQLGLMGEAGPEAIMPLERGPDGKLGVRNNGGGAVAAPAKVVVVFGEQELANAMASAAGEQVTIAHVRNNWGALNGGN